MPKPAAPRGKALAAQADDPLAPLTALQRKYVAFRAEGMAPMAAAKAAGIVDPNGTAHGPRYEQHPGIKAALAAANKTAMRKLSITRETVLEGFMDAVRGSSTSTELVMAWREIGKMIGAYEPQQVKISHELLLPDKLRVMTDAQLAQVAGLQGLVIDGECSQVKEG